MDCRIDIQARILLAHLESGLVSISGACTSQRIGQTGILMDISRADLMALLRVQARYAELQDLILSAVSVWVAEKRAAEVRRPLTVAQMCRYRLWLYQNGVNPS